MTSSSLLCLLTLSAMVSRTVADYTFLGIGDWGGAYLSKYNEPNEAYYKQNVDDVAAQMDIFAQRLNPQFVINTGDNFYWCGIQNTSDVQIYYDFEQPYNYSSLTGIKWYSALGNHEYGYSVEAQIEYMSMSNNHWYMPDRYYTTRIQLDASHYMSLIVLDTSPCVSNYRRDNQSHWDPCSTQYPTCSLRNTNDDFEGPCKFHENILGQNCATQYQWLQATLMGIPRDDWLVIVGHHPIDECDVRDLTSLIQNRGFGIYLNGHTHTMQQYTIDGKGSYVTTGAGSMVNTTDQTHEMSLLKLSGESYSTQKVSARSNANNHVFTSVCKQTVAGFTTHTFNSDFTTLTTQFVGYTGTILNEIVTNRDGSFTTTVPCGGISPAPSRSPTAAP